MKSHTTFHLIQIATFFMLVYFTIHPPSSGSVPWIDIPTFPDPYENNLFWSLDSKSITFHQNLIKNKSRILFVKNLSILEVDFVKDVSINNLSIEEKNQFQIDSNQYSISPNDRYVIYNDLLSQDLVFVDRQTKAVRRFINVKISIKGDKVMWSQDGNFLNFGVNGSIADVGYYFDIQYIPNINTKSIYNFTVNGKPVLFTQSALDTLTISLDGKSILGIVNTDQGAFMSLIKPLELENTHFISPYYYSQNDILDATFHPTDLNKILFVTNQKLIEYDLSNNSFLDTLIVNPSEEQINLAAFSPNGEWLIADGFEPPTRKLLRIRDLYPGLPTPTPPPPRQPLTLTTACDHWQGGVAWQVNNPNTGADIPIIWEIPAVTRFGSNVIKRSSQTILNLYYDALGINTASSVKIYVDGVVEAQANAPTCPSRPDTPAIYRPSTATFHFPTLPSVTFGNPNDHPITGDWDGDGVDTLGVFDPLAGRFLLRNSNTPGAPDLSFLYGNPGDIPLAGHWTAASTHDGVGTYRNTNGTMYLFLRNQLTTGYADLTAIVGNPGDLPIVGDWNGDGVDTVGLYRPVSTTFYLFNRNAPDMEVETQFTLSGGVPIAGRWTGSGGAGVGFFADGVFSLKDTPASGAFDRTVSFGMNGDIPLTGRWSP